jgi:hypothetical protein
MKIKRTSALGNHSRTILESVFSGAKSRRASKTKNSGGGIGHLYYTEQEDEETAETDVHEHDIIPNNRGLPAPQCRTSHCVSEDSRGSSQVEMYSDAYVEFQLSSRKYSTIISTSFASRMK